ncbi:MAG: hypothetical protein KDF65_16140 [Anaerolineae bacterium]|nr:hypothetical protein [Anaerolineae bacterium]
MSATKQKNSHLYQRALFDSVVKLDPQQQIRNPLIFVIEVISLFLTGLWLWMLVDGVNVRLEVVAGTVASWLWLTVLFTNFADAVAEGRREAQAESLRRGRHEIKIRWLNLPPPHN